MYNNSNKRSTDDIILFLNHQGHHQYIDIGSGNVFSPNHPLYKKRFVPINATYFSDTMTESQAKKALSDYLGPAARRVHLSRYEWGKTASERKKRDYRHPTLKQRLMAPFTNPVTGELLKDSAMGAGVGVAGMHLLKKKAPLAASFLPLIGSVAGLNVASYRIRKRVSDWQEKAKRTRAANRLKKKMGLQTSK